MSAIETFRFGGYTLRPAGGSIFDYRVAKHWTERDPHHRETVEPKFWITQTLNQSSYVLQDKIGLLFFFSAVRTDDGRVQIHIQFPPESAEDAQTERRKKHIIEGMQDGLPWLERVLRQSHAREIFFDSENEPLIAFCVKRLGFSRDGNLLRKSLLG